MNFFGKITQSFEQRVIKTSDITLHFNQVLDEMDEVLVKESAKLRELKDKNKIVLSKVDTLKNLGFTSAEPIKNNEQLEKNIRSKEQIIRDVNNNKSYIDRYKIMFPGYKFVPENIFINILKKYNIYNCDSQYYIKDIPDSNLEAIVQFRGNFFEIKLEYYSSHGYYSSRDEEDDIRGIITKDSEKRSQYNYKSVTNNFKISAPLSDFNFGDRGKTRAIINQEKNSVRVENIKVDDPIVNIKVPGGYIIVTAWDKEALDPEILNAESN